MADQQTIEVLEIFSTFQQMCQDLYSLAESGQSVVFYQLCDDMSAGLRKTMDILLDNTNKKTSIQAICESVLDTLRRIRGYFPDHLESCLKKIEFELLPLLQEVYGQYYFFQYLSEHPEKLPEYYEKTVYDLFKNEYIDEAEESGKYKYEVSFYVLAYNKLDYTRKCVESLLENIPAGLNYEIILINHGSSDGTKEYFESLHPHKQLDIAVNGGGMDAVNRIFEGEFSFHVSNDVVITPYAIENLITCIRSDPKIAWAVPSTPNVSNLQTIPAQYSSLDECMEFARRNNRSDPFRWEQRVRLCNPITVVRNSVWCGSKGLCLNGWYHTSDLTHYSSFPDDRASLLFRRHGYKLMLCKDAYCHHFGSVTLKDEIKQKNEQKYYMEGRREFYRAFNVDPWGPGFCYDPVFLNQVVGEEPGHVEVLGINCGLGSNSLRIKEQIKEYCHNTDCTLTNITDDPRYLADLKGVSDSACEIRSIKEFKSFLRGKTFHYIVWELPFLTQYKFRRILDGCLNALLPSGKLLLKLKEHSEASTKDFSGWKSLNDGWILFEKGGNE